mmetsp:Transcript_39090/g.75822  ORF Transcript_39090/g.75822 Transcript_39090/m.75822 type:complete len:284 (+) Transcript_39090:59-910(+)
MAEATRPCTLACMGNRSCNVSSPIDSSYSVSTVSIFSNRKRTLCSLSLKQMICAMRNFSSSSSWDFSPVFFDFTKRPEDSTIRPGFPKVVLLVLDRLTRSDLAAPPPKTPGMLKGFSTSPVGLQGSFSSGFERGCGFRPLRDKLLFGFELCVSEDNDDPEDPGRDNSIFIAGRAGALWLPYRFLGKDACLRFLRRIIARFLRVPDLDGTFRWPLDARGFVFPRLGTVFWNSFLCRLKSLFFLFGLFISGLRFRSIVDDMRLLVVFLSTDSLPLPFSVWGMRFR